MQDELFDVLVVGGGHAGCEAAAAAARLGASTLLVTMNMQTIGQMSCNPAMGGVAKGQIVRELDAMGGYSGVVTDETMIQFRMLNRSKGPAMWSPRAQSDRMRFAEVWRLKLEALPNLHFRQEAVVSLLVRNKRIEGVQTNMGNRFRARTVILTNGTFLNGLIHVGDKRYGGGRSGENASYGLSEQLAELGFETGRMKTGTPPRVDGRTIDYSRLTPQPGEEPAGRFSYLPTPLLTQQLPCYIGFTNPKAHRLLEEGLNQSPLYNGTIQSTGPRYCPSIEDKIVRFAEKDRHQLFVEPEGWHTCEVYLNGFSSSLPEETQLKALRLVEGFENARLFRPGYAIEYDYFPPHQLHTSLETRLVDGLFFAGQINGTTGYEEAGCQGLLAGLNAVRKIRQEPPIVLGRNEAYMGVLVDDLIHKSTDEPYRMFTSRAEYRILLRQDNADQRLTPLGRDLGLVDDVRWDLFQQKQAAITDLLKVLRERSVAPEELNGWLEARGETPLKQKVKFDSVLTRPKLNLALLAEPLPWLRESLNRHSPEVQEQAEIQVKYAGYIAKEKENADKLKRLENLQLPANYDYSRINSLSNEAKEKLQQRQPASIGQAARISGVNPSDISVLLVHLGR